MDSSPLSAHVVAPGRRRLTIVPAADGWVEGPRPVQPEPIVGGVLLAGFALLVAGAAVSSVSETAGTAVSLAGGALIGLAVLAVVAAGLVGVVAIVFGIGSLATRRGRRSAGGEVRRVGRLMGLSGGLAPIAQVLEAHPGGVPVPRSGVARVDAAGGTVRPRVHVTFADGSVRTYRAWSRRLHPALAGTTGSV